MLHLEQCRLTNQTKNIEHGFPDAKTIKPIRKVFCLRDQQYGRNAPNRLQCRSAVGCSREQRPSATSTTLPGLLKYRRRPASSFPDPFVGLQCPTSSLQDHESIRRSDCCTLGQHCPKSQRGF